MEHVVICQHSHLKPQILPPHLKQFKEQAHHYPLPILVAVPNNSPPAVVANQEDSPADRQEDNSPVVVHQETRKVGQGVHSKAEAAREVNKKEKVVKEVNSKAEAVQKVNSKAASSVERVDALKN
jgi:hypothetical protein